MDDGVDTSLTPKGNWPICWLGEGAAFCLGSKQLVESPCEQWLKNIDWTWLDFSLHFGSCCLLRVCRKFGPELASHNKPVKNEV